VCTGNLNLCSLVVIDLLSDTGQVMKQEGEGKGDNRRGELPLEWLSYLH
jgi:hypothetical protein